MADHEYSESSLHKRVEALERYQRELTARVGEMTEWKMAITTSIRELTGAMTENTVATKKTLVAVNHMEGIIKGDIEEGVPGLHADVRDLKKFAGNISEVLVKIRNTLLSSMTLGVVAGIVWIIRQMTK